MRVEEFLEDSAARTPRKVGLVANGQRLTYAAVDGMANRLAHALIQIGVKRGDRVAICLPNSVEAVVGLFAILKAGGAFVVINPATKPEKLVCILKHCGAKVLITDDRVTRHLQATNRLDEIPSLEGVVMSGKDPEQVCSVKHTHSFEAIQNEFPSSRPPRTSIDLDLTCLIYTSGTTGEPKGVMCDHGNMVFAASSTNEYLRNSPDDILLNVLPLSYSYGLYQLLTIFQVGGMLVLEGSFAYPAAVLERIQQERVTGFAGVPTIFAMLAQMNLTPFDLTSLRYLTNAAAAISPDHIQILRRKLPGIAFYSMYGLTETKRALYLPPDQLDIRPGSVGIAIPGTEVWVEDDAGNRLGPNQVGELVVRGRHVMRGYWGDPAATAARFRPGPLPGERVCHTGDLFRMDADGYFYFVSRKDDIIKCRGEKVAPKEIENVLYGLKGVVEAAVVGVPDPILGQAIKAIVVLNGTKLSETQVLAHCRKHLEDFMVPKYVEFRGTLPKTASGKITKKELV